MADASEPAFRRLEPEIEAYYSDGHEAGRLLEGRHGPLELARTQELLVRHLPGPPCKILDIGGGPGLYACWLARRNYTVHLVDATPLHVEQARRASAAQPTSPLASVRLGDARQLDAPDASIDVVLLLGPLYHLTEREERLAALREARRVLKAEGLLFAAAVSRFASLLDGVVEDLLVDPEYGRIVERDLRDDQHRNDTARDFFTTAFFHRPEELAEEVIASGFSLVEELGVEGPAWLLNDLPERWKVPDRRTALLRAARAVEREPSLLGMSAHLMAVARRPG